ncbi:signal transduction histidine kinase regulating citrate/malate metabolism [Desulfosporosinus orientis DSM 765]|uniref:histidine kinase n=1 Tax=Desulfosporosinus orientis (strain ATCC 19365 / DSM 765 / NCIMB 8382 / VKM B-1628 / Singapore I) TaxID=768706 RepID=G7WEZ3_DESOD|nr:sensor histidine kinase [Desulfosporosinus orientis]AET67322.1 signal transduction histidine kinase regulating citrate/malate metabolism [Desulfosporosinus orientis DSM 765]
MKIPHLKLGTQIAILSFILVLLSVLIAGVVIVNRISGKMEQEIGSRAMAIARTVAQLQEVQENLSKEEGSKKIQPLAERIRIATGVEYIVIFNMERIRYSHPYLDRVGTVFNDGDEGPALQRKEYLSQAVGVLGPSIRAFVPVLTDEGTRQVGVVAVGILVPTIRDIISTLRIQLYSSLLVGLALGVAGSFYLARNIKKNMFSLEPEEIARMLEERVAIFQAMDEGVVALDINQRITVINEKACRIAGITKTVLGAPLYDLEEFKVFAELQKGRDPAETTELRLGQTWVLINFMPVKVKEQVVGQVITIKDKTEVRKMAEELTGVKTFIEALRVQNHESLNKLHTIAGLIQLNKVQDAMEYVYKVTEEQQEVTKFLSKKIRHPSVAGLMLGKYNRGKELKVEVIFDEDSSLGDLPESLDSNTLTIILGNLLENAMEAVVGKELCEVHCRIKQEETELVISIEDTGAGIAPDDEAKVFQWGFSTKGTENRGIGLPLVKQTVERLGGTIDLESGKWGTRFGVRIPLSQVHNV